MMATTAVEDNTPLSKQYETPLGLAHDTMQALKDRIKTHYDLASEYYLSLWSVSNTLIVLWSSMAPRLLTMPFTTQGHPYSPWLLAYARVKG